MSSNLLDVTSCMACGLLRQPTSHTGYTIQGVIQREWLSTAAKYTVIVDDPSRRLLREPILPGQAKLKVQRSF